MKKRVLNLSLLLLLSASFNASAMIADGTKFTEGTNAYVNVSNIVSGAGELISTATKSLEAASKAVVSGNEGIAQTAVNQAVDSIVNLDNIPPILLSSSPETVKMTEEIRLLSKAFEKAPKTAYLKDFFCKSFAKLGNLPSLVNQNKTLTGVCAAGVVLAGYGAWKYLSRNKATASSQNLENSNSRSANLESTSQSNLQDKINQEIETLGGLEIALFSPQNDINLFHKYTSTTESDLEAVKYLTELVKTNFPGKIHEFINRADETGRTPLMQASFKGKNDIVKYLLENGADKNMQTTNGLNALLFTTLNLEGTPGWGPTGTPDSVQNEEFKQKLREIIVMLS